jgi:hypothetical protein
MKQSLGAMLSASGLHAEFRAASFLSWGLSTNHALGSYKHSFLWFNLFVKMKPLTSSIVSSGSSLRKNETRFKHSFV